MKTIPSKIDCVRNCIGESAAYFFVSILNFTFTCLIKRKILVTHFLVFQKILFSKAEIKFFTHLRGLVGFILWSNMNFFLRFFFLGLKAISVLKFRKRSEYGETVFTKSKCQHLQYLTPPALGLNNFWKATPNLQFCSWVVKNWRMKKNTKNFNEDRPSKIVIF